VAVKVAVKVGVYVLVEVIVTVGVGVLQRSDMCSVATMDGVPA
jgi:hypothetical protein